MTGSQAESPLGVVVAASRIMASDLAAVERDAAGIAVDAVGLIAAGLRLADGDGCHGEPVTRHLVPARLWHADAARRAERADTLRRIADVLDGPHAPTEADLLDTMPDGWIARTLRLSAADVLRRRVDETEAASGLDRRAFTRANQSAVASVGRGPLRRILNLIRAVAFTARGNQKH
ncbi:MAG: hypothetical protein ACT4PL_08635 [Phycisphaerales bacterium]